MPLMTNQTLSLQVTKKMEIVLTPAGSDYSVDDSQWAINWFDVKSKWLYDLYNKLASPHVYEVGGRPFFKGRFIKRLLGEPSDEREILLIVNYTKAQDFLDMVGNKKFQIKSLIRESAVKDFTFGFVKRNDSEERPELKVGKYDGQMKYMVHHFKNGHDSVDVEGLKSAAEAQGVSLHFSGIKAVMVERKQSGGELKTASFLMDSILLFESADEEKFELLLEMDHYQNFIQQNESNYIGVFGREF